MLKRIRKVNVLIVALIALLMMTACGNKEQKNETDNDKISSTPTIAATATEAPAEPTNTPTPTPEVELDAAFDEEFTVKTGDVLNIGREGILLSMYYVSVDNESISYSYQLTIDDNIYEGTGSSYDKDVIQVNQDTFSENRVRFISADAENQTVTLEITSGTEVKEPLVLSGNAEDEYTTTKPEYVETENMVLYLDEGIKVYGNTMDLITKIREMVENETGYYLENDSVFATFRGSDVSFFFGQDEFAGVDPMNEKFHVLVVPFEKSSPCNLTYTIVVNPEDLEIAAGEGFAIAHELAHACHLANGVDMGQIMNEGYATYIVSQICESSTEIPFNFDSDMNYSYFDVEITADNAETEFINEYSDGWYNYLYGYRFMNFLFETYGDDVFSNILEDANASMETDWDIVITGERITPVIKANTSDDVFVKFASWLTENKSRFDD